MLKSRTHPRNIIHRARDAAALMILECWLVRALVAVEALVIVVLSCHSLLQQWLLDIVEYNCRKLEEGLEAPLCSIVVVAALPSAVEQPNYLAHALLGLIFDPSCLIAVQRDTFVHRQSLASSFPLDQSPISMNRAFLVFDLSVFAAPIYKIKISLFTFLF